MSVALEERDPWGRPDEACSRPWERKDDPDGVGRWLAFCFGWALFCAATGFVCRAAGIVWGPTVTLLGEQVQLNWSQILWFGFPVGFAFGVRSKGGGLAATIGVFLLLVTTVLAIIAFGPGVGILPNI